MEQRLQAEESELRLRRIEREAAEEQRRLDHQEERWRREEMEEARRQEREEERKAREETDERPRREREEEHNFQHQQLMTMMQVVMSGAMAFMGMKSGNNNNNNN
jgi:hypothetical protein